MLKMSSQGWPTSGASHTHATGATSRPAPRYLCVNLLMTLLMTLATHLLI